MNRNLPPSKLLRVREAAAFLQCCRNHLRRLMRAGQLTAIDVSHPERNRPAWRITRASLDRFILRSTECTGGKNFWPNLSGEAKPNAAMRSKSLRGIATPGLGGLPEDKGGRVGPRRQNRQ